MTAIPWRRLLSLLSALIVLAIVAVVATLPDLSQELAQSARMISPMAVLVMLPVQIMTFLLCAGALSALQPGVSFRYCLASRVLRDAGGNLLVFFPGLGEAIGARALVLAGGQTRAAITASTLDVLAEGLAQVPYGILAVAVVPELIGASEVRGDWIVDHLPVAAAVIALLGAIILLCRAMMRARGGMLDRLVRRLRAEIAQIRADWASRRRGMAIAIALHFLAWALDGFQLWLAARVLGIPLDLFEAVVVQSAAYAVRAVIFFVPAGLAVQEAALVVACEAFGINMVDALALALVLRLRDVVSGLPLLGWPLLEYRYRARLRAQG